MEIKKYASSSYRLLSVFVALAFETVIPLFAASTVALGAILCTGTYIIWHYVQKQPEVVTLGNSNILIKVVVTSISWDRKRVWSQTNFRSLSYVYLLTINNFIYTVPISKILTVLLECLARLQISWTTLVVHNRDRPEIHGNPLIERTQTMPKK